MVACLLLAAVWLAGEEPVERITLYGAGIAAQHTLAPWNQRCAERTGTDPARFLWLNEDWQSSPWAGVGFRRTAGEGWLLTPEWLSAGFIRFLINGGFDRYGSPNGALTFQARPEVAGTQYQRVNTAFIDRGRGIDEDDGSWQEVLMPLRFWTNLKPGQEVRGLSIQCYDRVVRAYGLAEIGFVRYASPPSFAQGRGEVDTRQPEVSWPAYADLPPHLQADRRPPRVTGGRFTGPDGKRVFVLNPYCAEDQRLDLLGTTKEGARVPSLDLFDEAAHGWIYQELANLQALCRLGYNSYSATMAPQPFWDSVGYQGGGRTDDPSRLPATVRRVGLPFFVDTVAWPWTLGAPGNDPGKSQLPPEAVIQGRHHWTWYRPDGAGRETWLKLWRVCAERYRDAGATVLVYELFNEPAYRGVSSDHIAGFQAWLLARYGTLDKLNATWGTALASWAEAAAVKDETRDAVAGRHLDYDEYLQELFTRLTADGVREVNAVLPQALVGVQPMGGYVLLPREAIWKHRLVAHETVVMTPTGGGRWAAGRGATRPAADPLDHPLAASPLEPDLLRALAGSKMIVDNETYLRGQTALDVRNRLWEQVFAGLDGLSVFSWSRRGWIWSKGRQDVLNEADKFPYCELNPFVRPTAALRGIHDFAQEVQSAADRILPKPWGPAPKVGLLYSWAQARRQGWDPVLQDRSAVYHQALTYGHWSFAMAPSDRPFEGFEVLVAPGLRHVEAPLLERLRGFVDQGGQLVVAVEALDRDLYDQPLDSAPLLGASFGPAEPAGTTALALDPPLPLVGLVRPLTPAPGTAVALRDGAGRPLVTRRPLGRGTVWVVGVDVAGYRLVRLLGAVLDQAAGGRRPGWVSVEVRDAAGAAAPNVLVSRRSYADHEALLVFNRDGYDRRVRLLVPGLTGRWTPTPLVPAGAALPPVSAEVLAGPGLSLDLPAGEPTVVDLVRLP